MGSNFIIPLSVDIDNQIARNNDSKINNSKTDFEKVLSGESIDENDIFEKAENHRK